MGKKRLQQVEAEISYQGKNLTKTRKINTGVGTRNVDNLMKEPTVRKQTKVEPHTSADSRGA